MTHTLPSNKLRDNTEKGWSATTTLPKKSCKAAGPGNIPRWALRTSLHHLPTCPRRTQSAALMPTGQLHFFPSLWRALRGQQPRHPTPTSVWLSLEQVHIDVVNTAIHTECWNGPRLCTPKLCTLFTHDCVASQYDTSIMKCVDDTKVIGLFTGGKKAAYKRDMARQQSFLQQQQD